jgi:hypothetical protein
MDSPPDLLLEGYLAMAAVLDSNGEGWGAQDYLDMARGQLDRLPPSARKTLCKHDYMIAWFTHGWAGPSMTIPAFQTLVIEEESLLGREHRRTLEAVDHLVGSLMSGEQFIDAKALALSLYLRCSRVFGDNHVQTAYAAGKFGLASLKINDLNSAEWGLSKASEILAASFPESHQSRSVFLEPLSQTYERLGMKEEAEEVRERINAAMIRRLMQSS